jgi:Domain of unknown function (DUF1735)
MKYRIRILTALLVMALVGMTGCLKDKDFDNGSIQSVRSLGTQKIIELSTAPHDTTGYINRAYPISTNDTTIQLIPVTLASADPAPVDIHVTLTLSQALLDNYNDSNGTTFVFPDSSIYTILNPGNVVTIAKGTNVGFLMMKFAPADFIGANPFAFAYVISSVDQPGYIISGNLNKAIAAIGPKNKYDGLYNMDIMTTGWAAFGISDGVPGTWPTSNGKSIGLITSGANSVAIFDYAVFGSRIQNAFTTAGGFTGFGATAPQFTFDPNTDSLINVNNLDPDDGRGRAFHLNTAVAGSRFVPGSGGNPAMVYAAYIMVQNGRPNQFIYDTLTYAGSR